MNKLITERQQGFLDAYQVTGQVKSAAARAGCSRELHYGALRTSETYREAFDLVEQRRAAELEDELWQRAVYGVKIPKFYRGEVIGYEIRYSDTLLMRLLEARDPEKFGGIREELQRQSREEGLGVRWDREEVARPTLPRMTGPMPPAPPRPPRPPVPPIAECGEPVTYAEWAAARGITGTVACGPVDEEKLQRWAAGENLGSVEWVPDEAAMDLVSEDADSEEEFAEADGSGSFDSDLDFCVRWGAAEPDWVDEGSALPASEEMEASVTRPGGPGWGTGAPFGREENAPGADDLGGGDSDVGSCVRWEGRGQGESSATVGRFPVGERFWRGEGAPALWQALVRHLRSQRPATFGHALSRACHTKPAARRDTPRAIADCRPRLNRGRSRAPPPQPASHTARLGVAASLAQPIVRRRPGPAERWGYALVTNFW